MRQRYVGPEQNVRPGTEYARSIARYRPRNKRQASLISYLDHPLAPAIALGLLAAAIITTPVKLREIAAIIPAKAEV